MEIPNDRTETLLVVMKSITIIKKKESQERHMQEHEGGGPGSCTDRGKGLKEQCVATHYGNSK